MAIDTVHVTLASLQTELSTLRTMLESFPCRYAWLADLPMTDMDNPFPDTLKIAEIGGRKHSLRDNAGRLFADLSYADSLQDNKNTQRTAGMIVLEAEIEQQVQLTFQCYVINRLKRQLRDVVSDVPEDQRQRIRVDKNRRINLIQAYRRIAVFARPVNRFSFGWAKNSSTIHKTTVSAFTHHLTLTAASTKSTKEQRTQALRDIKVLESYPDGPLTRRRRIPPTPIVSVTVSADGKPKYFKRSASSPLLAFIEPGHTLPHISVLEDCRLDHTHETRPDYQYTPVLPHRDLFISKNVRQISKKHATKEQRNAWLNRV